jgi:hypothetical protein
MTVSRRLGLAGWMGAAFLVASVVPAAAKASVDRIENVDSVLAVAIPEEFPPTRAFHNSTGPCLWTSDYWLAKDGTVVFASSVYVVTPSGKVHARSWYPAEPLVCE